MTYEQFWSVMIFIFTKNFFLTGAVCLLALLVLLSRRFWFDKLPYRLAVACWWFLVMGGIAAAAIALLNLPNQGTDESQLAILVYIFGASPLMICGAVALFFFPKKRGESRTGNCKGGGQSV